MFPDTHMGRTRSALQLNENVGKLGMLTSEAQRIREWNIQRLLARKVGILER